MKAIFSFTVFMAVSLFLREAVTAGDIAVIVNKENPTSEVSYHGLVKLFKMEKQHWEDGRQVYLIMQEAGSSEKEVVLKKIFRMDQEGLKKFWLTKMFRGEIASFPKTLSSNAAVRRFISQVPYAIGFIDAAMVDESVKVLRIDGKLPGEKEYFLSDR